MSSTTKSPLSKRAAAVLALGIATLAPDFADATPALRVEGSRFVDDKGRTVILRGVNAAGNSKVPPFRPAQKAGFFDPLPALGYNVVRLLFTWEAYEPTKGKYDVSYLDYYEKAAKAAGDAGLFVIVDFHQDAFSRASLDGCGEGFPQWAVPSNQVKATPDNGEACESWGPKMKGDMDMQAAFTAFYADTEGVRTSYLAMVESVSSRLASHPEVIGYDMLNEPWGDEVTEIGPLYEDAAKSIRKASPDAILFVSPRALTSAGNPTELVKPTFSNFVYSPHFYDASVVLFDSWSGVLPDTAFGMMDGTAAAWGVPLFLGEFGASGITVDGDKYMQTMYDHLDAHLSSSAQWVYTPDWTSTKFDGWNNENFSIVDSQSKLRSNFVYRPFPMAVAGEITAFKYEPATLPESSRVTLEWDSDSAAGETVLYAPTAVFLDTPVIEVTGEMACSIDEDQRIRCVATATGAMKLVVSTPPVGEGATDKGGCGVSRGSPSNTGLWVTLLGALGALSGWRRRARR